MNLKSVLMIAAFALSFHGFSQTIKPHLNFHGLKTFANKFKMLKDSTQEFTGNVKADIVEDTVSITCSRMILNRKTKTIEAFGSDEEFIVVNDKGVLKQGTHLIYQIGRSYKID
jgi:hypothetical protein